jgi:hypothetical protein
MKAWEVRKRFVCSPRPRGWSHRDVAVSNAVLLLPAPAGMASAQRRLGRGLLPAPEGMVPKRPGRRSPSSSAPRGHGDGPRHLVTDAHSRSRSRGDGPKGGMEGSEGTDCSPRPLGWSHSHRERRLQEHLLPVPLGDSPSMPRPLGPPDTGRLDRHRRSSEDVSVSRKPHRRSPAHRPGLALRVRSQRLLVARRDRVAVFTGAGGMAAVCGASSALRGSGVAPTARARSERTESMPAASYAVAMTRRLISRNCVAGRRPSYRSPSGRRRPGRGRVAGA